MLCPWLLTLQKETFMQVFCLRPQISKEKDSYSALTNARGTGSYLVSFGLRATPIKPAAISKDRTVVLVTLSKKKKKKKTGFYKLRIEKDEVKNTKGMMSSR